MTFRGVNIVLVFILVLSSCSKEELKEPEPNKIGPAASELPVTSNNDFEINIPVGFDQLLIPSDNQLSAKRIALGERLFFDPMLSADRTVSCASCHKPELAFSGGEIINPGVEGKLGFRNSSTLTNVAYNERFMHDGGPKTLEAQAVLPFDNENEFNLSLPLAAERLNQSDYKALFEEAYGNRATPEFIMKALASYQRILISGNSPYDQYEYQGDPDALSAQARRGMELFFGPELSCASCHSGFNFTDYSLRNNGIYKDGDFDTGRERVTLFPNDIGRFKVPTLRNLSYTAPYMHDGRFATLAEVIDHYASGGNDFQTKDQHVKGFQISSQEKLDLISFLKSLDDPEFISNHTRD